MGKNPRLLSFLQCVISGPSAAAIWMELATMLLCVNMTPFGRPVVPDEYTRYARSSFGLIETLSVASEEPRRLEKCGTLFSGSTFPTKRIRSKGRPTFDAASRTTSRHARLVTSPLAFEDWSWDTSSSTVYRKFRGQITPPTRRAPKVAGTRSMVLGDTVASTSPLHHCHCSWSPLPNCSPLARIWLNVSFLPIATSTNSTMVMLGLSSLPERCM